MKWSRNEGKAQGLGARGDGLGDSSRNWLVNEVFLCYSLVINFMPTPTSQFDYNLPLDRIAQHSVEPRDHSKLMIVDRKSGVIEHKQFFNILDDLHAGDVLVFNNTKVFRARLNGKGVEGWRGEGKEFEIFLLRCDSSYGWGPQTPHVQSSSIWQSLIRPGKKINVGDKIKIADVEIIVKEKNDDGVALLEFPLDEAGVLSFTDAHGEIPIPPYVDEKPTSIEKYQTVYAKETGSVAAPTAGFHFTNELLEKIKAKGVEIAFVTLHVGIGTFRPMKSDTIEEHTMHAEFVQISPEVAQQINKAKQEKRCVIAVGTTTVRSLEGAAQSTLLHLERSERSSGDGKIPLVVGMKHSEKNDPIPADGFSADVNMFITPGFEFKVIDALITNFHLPKSTLLVLVSAFAGREHMLAAYEEAIKNEYRFFSFGDAMFVR